MAAQQAQPFRWHYDDLDDKNFHVHGGALLNLILLISVSVLLSSTLLCLLVRWAYRHSRRTAETGSVSMAPAACLEPQIIGSFPVPCSSAETGSVSIGDRRGGAVLDMPE
ncbi:uncharacterized protein LOC135611629 [Musa acuminata AAA Group]|uniref:uncharacterized protein LOC135611629 n=1 Tax=Musa acuminata AAA Group TaxID=214697 RepID=UPI0031D918F9